MSQHNHNCDVRASLEDGNCTQSAAHYQQLALAALKSLTWRTEAIVDAAHEVVGFDDYEVISNRGDFTQAVRAMIAARWRDKAYPVISTNMLSIVKGR